MSSRVEIANLTLQALGRNKIHDFGVNNLEADTVRDFYDLTKKTLLSKYQFKFAIARARIPSDTETPAFGYSKQYSLPANCLRVLRVLNTDDYCVEGGKILTDASAPLNVEYINGNVSESEFHPDFVQMFYLALAAKSCIRLTDSRAIKADLEAEFQRAEYDAHRNGSLQEVEMSAYGSDWEEVRRV